MTFSELLVKVNNIETEKGDLEGTCCICGEQTTQGHKKKFGGNFTCADYVSNGDVICPSCKHLVDNSNTYRRTMFLLTEEEFLTFKKNQAKDIVFNLPNKPFYIYLTKTWQKIGWIRMNEVYNLNNTGVINFIIDYDIIRVTLEDLKELCVKLEELRDLKIPKTVLEKGELEMHHYKKIVGEKGKAKAREISSWLQKEYNTPAFDLALYLID